MSNIIDFTARRLEKASTPIQPQKIIDVVGDAIDFLLGDWEKMARNNRLNDYFKASLPNFIDAGTRVNFMSDLTEVAKLELHFDMRTIVYFPGTYLPEMIGWTVRFKIGDEFICTPDMANECYARCFAILLFLRVKHEALALGLIK